MTRQGFAARSVVRCRTAPSPIKNQNKTSQSKFTTYFIILSGGGKVQSEQILHRTYGHQGSDEIRRRLCHQI